MKRRRRFLVGLVSALFGAGLLGLPVASLAQSAGSGRIVRLVVPFAPGGGQDILARSFNAELGAALGQPVVVEYRAGAGGGVGTAYVAKSDPESQTLIVSAASHIISALIAPKPLYDPIRDFSPVAHIGTGSQVLMINAQVPAKTLGEFVAYVKANPGKFNYGSAGNGSSTHLSMAYFLNVAGLDMTHIPYKSNAEPINELIAGRIQAITIPSLSALPYAKDSRVRMLAVTPRQRSTFLPQLPTIAESGYPSYSYESWFGLLGPAGMPKAFVDRVNAEMNKLLKDPVILERLSKIGIEPAPMTPDAFDKLLRADYERLARIVKLSGAHGG